METPHYTQLTESLRRSKRDSDEDWSALTETITEATLEYIELSDEDNQALATSFWGAHVHILERAEARQPGVARQVFERVKELTAQL